MPCITPETTNNKFFFQKHILLFRIHNWPITEREQAKVKKNKKFGTWAILKGKGYVWN